jgi:cytochrome P450
MSLPPFNPFLPELRSNPYPLYRRYREEDPVHWNGSQDHAQGSWCVFSHREVMSALKTASLGKSMKPMAPEPLGAMLGQWMLLRNPPHHTRLRGLVNQAFTPHVVDRLHSSIQ